MKYVPHLPAQGESGEEEQSLHHQWFKRAGCTRRLWRSNPAKEGEFGLAEFFKGPYLSQYPSVLFSFYSSIAAHLLKIFSSCPSDGHTLQTIV